ncbi:MAG: YybH family protein [Blastocatellia bacterium]
MSQDIEVEKAAIRECLEQLWLAYKRGDSRVIAELYHSNANLVISGNEVAVGQTAIEREYAKIIALDPVRPDSNFRQSLRIHLVTPGLAIVDAAGAITKANADGTEERLGEAFFTAVLVKETGQWRIAALRGASPDNISPPTIEAELI